MTNKAQTLTEAIDVVTEGEYAEHGEAKVVMTIDQWFAIRNTLSWNVDLDTVEHDNGEPERANLIRTFIATFDRAMNPDAA